MRMFLGSIVVACLAAASQAYAQEVVLSCLVEETGTNHARRTWEIEFDQQNQIVTVGKTVSTAAITDAKITFRVDLGTGVPFSFVIDRTTGLIRVSGNSGVLYNGQCKVATTAS
jgi:hypothetical protein